MARVAVVVVAHGGGPLSLPEQWAPRWWPDGEARVEGLPLQGLVREFLGGSQAPVRHSCRTC